jgi:hypothetical protein
VFYPAPPYLNAVDAETGDLLWRTEVDRGVVGPPITFMDHGKQRVAVTSTSGVTVYGLDGK